VWVLQALLGMKEGSSLIVHLRCESRSNAEYAALCRGRSGCFGDGCEGGGVVGEALKESYCRNLGACLFWRMEGCGGVMEK
jgi:hypothetical protein